MGIVTTVESSERLKTIMKQVDELVRTKQYDQALKGVRYVLEQDVKNVYARAYEERILALIYEFKKEELQVETEKNVTERIESEVRKRLREFQQQQEIESLKRKQFEKHENELEKNARKASTDERQVLSQKEFADIETEAMKRLKELEQTVISQMEKSLKEEQRRMEDESKQRLAEFAVTLSRAAVTGNSGTFSEQEEMLRVKNEYEEKLHKAKDHFERKAFKTLETERQNIEKEAFNRLREEHQLAIEKLHTHAEDERQQIIATENNKAKERALEAYRSLFLSMNTLKLDESIHTALLQSIRTPLNILPDDHASVVRSVQLNSYIEALKGIWHDGKPSDEEIGMIENLRLLYQISEGEHENILKTMKKEMGIPDESAIILAIDDDDMILQFVEHILKQTYRTVLTASSVNEGLQIIEEKRPAIILCDVHLKSPGIGGFAFYQNITKGEYGEKIKDIPFVLMSSISDEFFVESAKQLGVTAYVPKPFTRELLQSTVQTALTR